MRVTAIEYLCRHFVASIIHTASRTGDTAARALAGCFENAVYQNMAGDSPMHAVLIHVSPIKDTKFTIRAFDSRRCRIIRKLAFVVVMLIHAAPALSATMPDTSSTNSSEADVWPYFNRGSYGARFEKRPQGCCHAPRLRFQ